MEKNTDSRSLLVKGLIVSLILLAVGLVLFPSLFISPEIKKPEAVSVSTEPASEEDTSEVASTVNSAAPSPQRPWEDAQNQQARSDSQALLATLLENLKQLTDLKVEQWNNDALQAIRLLADEGDEHYAQGAYQQAIDKYTLALEQSNDILNKLDDVAENYFQLAQQSLEEARIQDAQAQLQIAQRLLPDAEHINTLLSRVNVREQVFALDLAAENFLRKQDLEAARKNYASIQALDPVYKDIDKKLQDLDARILEQNFKQAMSSGFQNLSSGNIAEAEAAFNKAGQLIPQSEAVTSALDQVEAAKITLLKQDRIDQAVALENAEMWHDALALYKTLLNEDSSLVSARLGKIRASARAKLDTNITNILNDPLRLQAEKAWQASNRLLLDAKSVVDRGPLLDRQISELEQIIKRARSKITLKLLSDNQTQIEIYRLTKLGKFKQHAVALYPGHYVVVGSRDGYRDVREDLVIDGFKPEIQLNIACTESI